MNFQFEVLLPIPILEEIIFLSALDTKLTFRVTCKRFLQFTAEHFFSTFTTTLCEVICPYFGVLDSSSNSLFVSDYGSDVIRKMDLSTNRITTLCGNFKKAGLKNGIGSEAQFHCPSGLALDEKERILYISDARNRVIRSMNLINGKVNTIIGGETTFPCPRGLALDSISNFLYVVDSENHAIQKIQLKEKRVETLCGKGTRGYKDGSFEEALFNSPFDVVLNSKTQELYISDQENNIIRILSLKNRTIATLCGIPRVSGYVNGSSTQAKFNNPRGLGFDSCAQCLYVGDNGNRVIRRICLSDKIEVSTVCGIPGKEGNKDGFFPTFDALMGIVVDPHSPTLYVLDFGNDRVRKITDKKRAQF